MTSSVTSRGPAGGTKSGAYGEYESLEELNSITGAPMPTSYSGSALNRLLTEDEQYLSRKYFNHRRYPMAPPTGRFSFVFPFPFLFYFILFFVFFLTDRWAKLNLLFKLLAESWIFSIKKN